jgi:hypothetical protein
MGSTLRNDTSKALFLERIARAWDKRPELTFGQLLDFATSAFTTGLLHATDTEIIQAVEHFVLLGRSPTAKP